MKKSEKVVFDFPKSVEELENVISEVSLRQTLQDLQTETDEGIELRNVNYKIRLQKCIYLYASCSRMECNAFLRFKRQENGIFRLMRWECRHQHDLPKTLKRIFLAVRDYLSGIPESVSTSTIKKLTCR